MNTKDVLSELRVQRGLSPDDLAAEEVIAVRYAPALEYWFDILNDEDNTPERIARQMQVLRRREEVETACQAILIVFRTRLNSYSR